MNNRTESLLTNRVCADLAYFLNPEIKYANESGLKIANNLVARASGRIFNQAMEGITRGNFAVKLEDTLSDEQRAIFDWQKMMYQEKLIDPPKVLGDIHNPDNPLQPLDNYLEKTETLTYLILESKPTFLTDQIHIASDELKTLYNWQLISQRRITKLFPNTDSEELQRNTRIADTLRSIACTKLYNLDLSKSKYNPTPVLIQVDNLLKANQWLTYNLQMIDKIYPLDKLIKHHHVFPIINNYQNRG